MTDNELAKYIEYYLDAKILGTEYVKVNVDFVLMLLNDIKGLRDLAGGKEPKERG